MSSVNPEAAFASATGRDPSFAWRDRLVFPFASLTLVAALLLGGGTHQGLISDTIVQLIALPLLVLAFWQLDWPKLDHPARFVLVLLGAIVLLMGLQLVPLPLAVWEQLPGRAELTVGLASAGAAPMSLPISLDPQATERMIWTLMPPIALFAVCLRLGGEDRRRLTVILVAFAALNVLLGLAQVADGPKSLLRFYQPTNLSDTVGFFANRNHYAALLYMALPLAAVWTFGLFRRHGHRPSPMAWLGAAALVLLILGLAMARSRAGVVLGTAALLASFALQWRNSRSERGLTRWMGWIVAAAILLGVQYGLDEVLPRFNKDLLEGGRTALTTTTIAAAKHFAPVGSGLGTFENAYQRFETNEVALSNKVNHAHNDWVELWLEGGWAAIALAILFLGWVLSATYRVWRTQTTPTSSLARAASIGAILVLFHEIADYSLRTTADLTVFALLCGLTVVSPPEIDQRRAKAKAASSGL